MNKRWPVVVGCVVVAAIALYFTFFRESDENAVKRVLSEFAKVVSVKESETIIPRTARVRNKMANVVTDNVSADVEELGVHVQGREKLEENAIKLGLVYTSADCALITKKIQLDARSSYAQVDATALVTANRGGERKVDKRDVHFLLRKDGVWKIDSIDVARPTE